MAKKPTVKQIRQMTDELLTIAPLMERYKELEAAIKAGLVQLKHEEVEIAGKGRVVVKQVERLTVSPELATDVLGVELARKVIVTKLSVPNDIISAFVKAGEISEAKREQLLKQAERTLVTNLYVRPLK